MFFERSDSSFGSMHERRHTFPSESTKRFCRDRLAKVGPAREHPVAARPKPINPRHPIAERATLEIDHSPR